MSKQNPLILQIAERCPSPSVEEAVRYLSGEVIVSDNTDEALTLIQLHKPEIVVIEAPMGSWVGQEMLCHLAEIGVRPLVILTDRRDLWDAEVKNGVYVRPYEVSGDALIGTLARALGAAMAW